MIAIDYEIAPSEFRIQLRGNPNIAYRRALRRGIGKALQAGERRIIVDCSSWSDLDLILLSALMDCSRACDEQGATFELENLGRDLWSRIEALRLGDRLGLRD